MLSRAAASCRTLPRDVCPVSAAVWCVPCDVCCALRAVWALCAVCTTCHMLRAGRDGSKISLVQWRTMHIVPLNQSPPQMVRERLAVSEDVGRWTIGWKLEYFQRWEAGQQVGDAGQLVGS